MNLHPTIVNITIFVLAAGILLELLYLFTKNLQFKKYGGILMIAGAVFASFSVFSGLRAFSIVEIPREALPTVETHRVSGLITLALIAVAMVLRFAAGRIRTLEKPLRWLYAAMLIAIAAMLFRTGSIGGDMAYKYQLRHDEPAKTPAQKPGFDE